MNLQTIVNCILIFAGSIIMLISIIRAKGLLKAMPFVPKRHQKQLRRYLVLHRGLMIFFLLGYLVVMTAFAFQYSLVSETFVSLIFFFGAIFVFIGIIVQSQLISEVQRTIQGIVPICSNCKKIRTADGDPEDQKTWKEIEAYIYDHSDAEFSHGICPECSKKIYPDFS